MILVTIEKSCWSQIGNHNSLCRDWKSCPYISIPEDARWFSISDIQYCRLQISWIIKNILDYVNGHYITVTDSWPPEPKGETGYTDTHVQHSISHSASFEGFRQITAEVLFRLERTGIDGRLLLQEIKRADLMEYSYEARQALNYISGWRRKRMSYSDWKRTRKWRNSRRNY